MKLQHLVLALAALWITAAVIAFIGLFDVMSGGSLVALGLFGALPPVATWFWWHASSQTLSESIHQARNGR